jgi:hypothetical protein
VDATRVRGPKNERDALDEDEALKVAYDEVKAVRRERGDSGKAAS